VRVFDGGGLTIFGKSRQNGDAVFPVLPKLPPNQHLAACDWLELAETSTGLLGGPTPATSRGHMPSSVRFTEQLSPHKKSHKKNEKRKGKKGKKGKTKQDKI
jgi:hypothetical protein